MKFLVKRTVYVIVVLGIIVGGGTWYLYKVDEEAVFYRTAAVERGDLLATISATGTVEPEEVVDVGAQVAGRINSFGKDKNEKIVDYGSVVEEGTILAEIDDSLYAADVAQATAQLRQTRAGVQRAEADLEQMKAKLYQAQRDWERAQKLGPSEALAESSYDAYKSAYETAKANVAIGEAAIVQVKATVSQAEAALQRSQRNLSYCTIKSPVKGVIIDRRVNIGQTVVASLNAPSLFLIAKDLKRMQVWVSVNEADIGNIHPGQAVSFTVDAYPGEVFQGEVGKVRLNANMTQNVVTYTVEVITDNSSGKLLPYLTANIQFELSNSKNVLLVPNAALRWLPRPEQVVAEFKADLPDSAPANGNHNNGQNHNNGWQNHNGEKTSGNGGRGVVWVPEGNYVRPIKVRTGPSDGTMTEVEGKELQEGMQVVFGEQQQATSVGTTNPFTPQFRGSRSSSRQ
jgi:HlyD family secretion protein